MQPIIFEHIFTLMKRLNLPLPLHPLITLVQYDQHKPALSEAGTAYSLHFYKIAFKARFSGQSRYGPGSYDFSEGSMAFVGPHQIVELSSDETEHEGYALFFHPDLLLHTSLAARIQRYGFFSYSVTEALFLSEPEKKSIIRVFEAIDAELRTNMDAFSQGVLVSQLELLLNYCDRFYNRQFLTRTPTHHTLIDEMNQYLEERFARQEGLISGLPTIQEIAGYLNLSPRYLSDMLKSLTGHTAQQHIHYRMIEKAKELLASDQLTTAEVAFLLGFEHPQSFNKFFRQKTGTSPTLYRKIRSN